MSKNWTEATTAYLNGFDTCPRCDSHAFAYGMCADCRADFRGPVGAEVRQASARAAFALELRQQIVDRVPVLDEAAVAAAPAWAAPGGVEAADVPLAASLGGSYVTVARAPAPELPAAPFDARPPAPTAPPSTGGELQISVQSVLAVAGAGLVAVAAIVFTFFNPELSDVTLRSTIVGAVTLLFLGGAVLLARRRLTFSAEAVGALAMVFVVLDIWALSQVAVGDAATWAVVGAGTLVSSAAMIAVAAAVRVRTWLWLGLVGVSVSPAMFAHAFDDRWIDVAGNVAVGFVAVALVPLIRVLTVRYASPLRADLTTSTVLRILVTTIVLVRMFALVTEDGPPSALGSAAVLASLALLAALSARFGQARFWSFMTGACAVVAALLLPIALPDVLPIEAAALLALVPLASVLGALAISRVRARGIVTGTLQGGAWTVVVAATVPATVVAAAQLVAVSLRILPADLGLGAVLGIVASLAGVSIAFSRSPAALGRALFVTALWAGVLAVLSFATWTAFDPFAQTAVAIAAALATSAAMLVLGRRTTVRAIRVPFLVLAPASLALAALISWLSPDITVPAGVVIVAAVAVVSRIAPARFRAAHVVAGFAYALAVFARALDLGGLDVIPILCLTTSLASLCALAATLVRRVAAGAWYAVLGVTAVPFLLGIVSVLLVRSGWTALSTAVTFALALTLVLTRRPGLNRWVRATAGGLLVPALAVIVICLGAQVLEISASPVTLPVIAVIVAAAFPLTPILTARLARRIRETDARAVRLFVEVSTYVTGALAVLLALVRSAAGLGTTLLVLLVLGLGAAAAGALTRRRLPWAVAAASFTGALWSSWGLVGVDVPEAYVLPPALGAVVLGIVFTRRGLGAGRWFSGVGLTFAVVPALGLLAVFGPSTSGTAIPWRTAALAAAAVVLLVVAGRGRMRRPASVALASVRPATTVLAVVAAAGPVVQAVRLGLGLDELPFAGPSPDQVAVMVPVLVLSAVGFGFAMIGGRFLALTPSGTLAEGSVTATTTSEPPPERDGDARASERFTRVGVMRVAFVPAAVYAVAGPICAVDGGWVAIVTLWLLTTGLLITMLLTARRGLSRPVAAPPVWLLFALAWVTAVAGWSARELRVEAFSLPLGLALTMAGVLAMRSAGTPVRPTFTTWPVGFAGSWRLLTPGLVVTLLPSMLATATDPLTWRAILVIALALAAILLGSLFKLGAPFILGILVLPIENAIVFVVQIGRSIGAAPWWMTLATAGAVLLLIAVTSERRAGAARGMGARLRDLK
ncbi:SCO7613 C-terminal domain-containing membrane protein [Herbiconiux ginsengi]|uniref:Uncharacterized protein n=1 Tax=Herbiconiux ginsengi TaxID=381665 RepID=A0A1H3KJG3_9MICO|nr:hypothetical protein [Herbiconiux ginsengi]SDY52273.1 hypothetical protein SAMN05216554_0588 [Herbiconiux ginsengi]